LIRVAKTFITPRRHLNDETSMGCAMVGMDVILLGSGLGPCLLNMCLRSLTLACLQVQFLWSGWRPWTVRLFKTFVVYDLLYADDTALCTSSPEQLQNLLNSFSHAWDLFGLTISLKKTVTLSQSLRTHAFTIN